MLMGEKRETSGGEGRKEGGVRSSWVLVGHLAAPSSGADLGFAVKGIITGMYYSYHSMHHILSILDIAMQMLWYGRAPISTDIYDWQPIGYLSLVRIWCFFFCLFVSNDTKQWCYPTKLDCTRCTGWVLRSHSIVCCLWWKQTWESHET